MEKKKWAVFPSFENIYFYIQILMDILYILIIYYNVSGTVSHKTS